jgi:hypothetical protein
MQEAAPGESQQYKDLYLLYVFTAIAYLCELVFTISRLDGSEDFSLKYQIEEV